MINQKFNIKCIKPLKNFISTSGFTLAEVLITLGIIGVVAAITIPTLLNNMNKRDNYVALQKALSMVSEAATHIRSENGNSMASLATTHLEFANLFKPYMRVTNFCENETDSENCYIKNTSTIYNLQGGKYGQVVNAYTTRPKIVTPDGFVYMFTLESASCNYNYYKRNGVSEHCGSITVDTNGTKKPNTKGKDIFDISVNKYNTTPYWDMRYSFDFLCSSTSNDGWNGANCAYRAITEGGINYY